MVFAKVRLISWGAYVSSQFHPHFENRSRQVSWKMSHQSHWMISRNYPLINIQKASENDHRNSGFTHKQIWLSIAMLVYQRVYPNKYPHFNWWKGSPIIPVHVWIIIFDAPNYKFAYKPNWLYLKFPRTIRNQFMCSPTLIFILIDILLS